MPKKLGVPTTQRKELLMNQASSLLWYGKIETTLARAKAVGRYAEKVLTLAINAYEDTVEETVTTKNDKGNDVKKTIVKDGAKKLTARRAIMNKVNDVQEVKGFKESKPDFKKRTADIKFPLIEKIFNELAPKYATRNETSGQAGGYTRVIKLGERKGDAAMVAIVELVD